MSWKRQLWQPQNPGKLCYTILLVVALSSLEGIYSTGVNLCIPVSAAVYHSIWAVPQPAVFSLRSLEAGDHEPKLKAWAKFLA